MKVTWITPLLAASTIIHALAPSVTNYVQTSAGCLELN